MENNYAHLSLIASITIPLVSVILGQYISHRVLLRRKRKNFFYKTIKELLTKSKEIRSEIKNSKTCFELVGKLNDEWNIGVLQSEVIKKIKTSEDGNFQVEKMRLFKNKKQIINQINMIDKCFNLILKESSFHNKDGRRFVEIIESEIANLILIKRGLLKFEKNNALTILEEVLKINKAQ